MKSECYCTLSCVVCLIAVIGKCQSVCLSDILPQLQNLNVFGKARTGCLEGFMPRGQFAMLSFLGRPDFTLWRSVYHKSNSRCLYRVSLSSDLWFLDGRDLVCGIRCRFMSSVIVKNQKARWNPHYENELFSYRIAPISCLFVYTATYEPLVPSVENFCH